MTKIAGNPYLRKKDDVLLIDEIPVSFFISRHQTPIMIFMGDRLIDNITVFKNAFNNVFENFECYYSVKANFLPSICKIIKNSGVGAEVVGELELDLVLRVGFDPNNIIVGGPFLSDEIILKSLQARIKEIIIYHIEDLKRVNEIAEDMKITQDICLRINSSKYKSKLGIDLTSENVLRICDLIKKCKNLHLTTLLSHYSSQMNNPKLFENNVSSIIKASEELSKHGIKIKNLNLGGGFPEAVIMSGEQLNKIAKKIKLILEKSNLSYEKIIFEPGRYLVGDVGVFLAQITTISGDRWVFMNVGNNICPKFARCSLRFYNASRIQDSHNCQTNFAGIVPTDQDVLAKDYYFTETISRGDIVLIPNVGAYCLTFSNRFPYMLPFIYLIMNKKPKLIFNPKMEKDFTLS